MAGRWRGVGGDGGEDLLQFPVPAECQNGDFGSRDGVAMWRLSGWFLATSTSPRLLERDIFDLFLPEFDKPWVIHLRETCCCSTNLSLLEAQHHTKRWGFDMSWPRSTSPTSSEVQLARQADDPWYIAYQDESTQWCSQRMDLEEKVANLGDELARKNLMIFELKRIVEEEKKNSELIRKEKLRVETDLAVFDQVVENLEHELQVMGEEKSRFIWAVLLGVIPVLAVMWFW
ncbi:hypothetical protein QYE76_031227 [Lolium multiflorum]|uniref:Uncharacterized protein n=1 Tax=Lolium multiflorum TaxID=4521 RepID=A0AAD8QT43_LOLMU|nr:hypothetical protein QYE76_031227 [Lolium multiflorum]